MTEPDWKAELLEDRTTTLAPRGSAAPGQSIDRRWAAAGIAAIATLAIAVVALYAPSLEKAAKATTPNPSASPLAALSIPTAAALPTPADGPCLSDRVRVAPPAGVDVPTWYRPIGVTAHGLAAFAVEDTASRGSLVVSGGDADGNPTSRVIASYATGDPASSVRVSPIGWSGAGDALLVRADQLDGSGGVVCTNLVIANVDGPGVTYLTDNGPGMTIEAAALAPSGDRVAYVQAGVVTMRSPARDEWRLADCSGLGSIEWSQDERTLLMICNDAIAVVDAETSASSRFALPDGWYPVFASWAGENGTIIVVATGAADGQKLAVLDLDPATTGFDRRDGDIESVPPLLLASLAPGGRWIILEGQRDDASSTVMAAVDLTTGASTDLPTPLGRDIYSATGFTWLADGDTALYGLDGSLYSINIPTATLTDAGLLPATQFAWHDVAP
jgi:hypothetical protein